MNTVRFVSEIPAEFKTFDTPHLLTSNPNFLQSKFPTLFKISWNGGKYRVQAHRIRKEDVYKAIDSFWTRLERKYGCNDQALLTWSTVLKSQLEPLLLKLPFDIIVPFKDDLKRAHEQMIITQVDKDKSGIAFICKKVAYALTKRFIYELNPKKEGLF